MHAGIVERSSDTLPLVTRVVTRRRGLTREQCERAKPGYLWDATVAGLGLRVRDAGSRIWIFRYRSRGARKQIVIGRLVDVTPDDARKIARLRAADVVHDRDPLAEIRSKSVRELLDYFERNHRTRRKGRAPADDRDSVRRCAILRERWGSRRAAEIRCSDVAELLEDIAAPYASNRMRSLVRTVWNLARRWGFVPPSMVNPAEGAPVNPEHPRTTRALTTAELARLVVAAAQYPSLSAGTAIGLLVLTGARLGEVLGLRRSDVDLDARTITFRDRKDGGVLVLPLSDSALEGMRHLLQQHDSVWCFPGPRGSHLVDIRKPWAWCCKHASLPSGTRIHDARAAVATAIAASAGLRAAQQVLGHADSRTTLRYTRPGDVERRAGVDALELAIANALK